MSPNPPAKPPSAIAILDVLRAFAALAVLAWHSADAVAVKMPLFSSAAWAVDLFMAISGFLMLHHFRLREAKEPWEAPATWWRFWVRRWFRIVPLYVVALAAMWFLTGGGERGAGAFFRHFFLHVSFVFGFIPAEVESSGLPDWSLALEMQFYLAFPFLALALRRIGAGWFFLGCAVVGLVFNQLIGIYRSGAPGPLGWWPQPSLLPLKIHVFAFGMVLAEALHRGPKVFRDWRIWIGLALVLPASKFNYMKLEWVLWVSIAGALAVPAVAGRWTALLQGLEARLGRTRIFHWPAELSYGIYLLHNIVLSTVFVSWPDVPGGTIFHPQYGMFLVAVAISVAVIALPLFLWVERPGIAVGRNIAERFRTHAQKSSLAR